MPTLADIILTEREDLVRRALNQRPPINIIDEYGFTPLIEAAIADHAGIAHLLLSAGAEVDLKDMTGSTALHWAAENNNLALAKELLERGADPNAYNLSGQPLGVLPFLRGQREMRRLLESHGANVGFIKDYVNTKQLGHMFELVGFGSILSPKGELVEVSFEGFMPEVTIAMIAESLGQFQNHFAARVVRRYAGIAAVITEVLHRAARLIRFQQYRVDVKKHQQEIFPLIQEDPLLIPVSFEGHAITFIRHGDFLAKCDRREDSRLFDSIIFYRIGRLDRMNNDFVQQMIYKKQSDVSVNELLPSWLELSIVGHLHIPAQITGNCSWANVEGSIPALFYLLKENPEKPGPDGKLSQKQAMEYFNQWRKWNCERALLFCLRRFLEEKGLGVRATIAETLAAVLFQACNKGTAIENERAERIITALSESPFHEILRNYVKVWAYEDTGPEGRHFLRMLEKYGYHMER